MTTDLTDIDGVGSDKAESLADDGYETIEDVANANPEELETVSGFGPGNVDEIIENATDAEIEALVDETVEENPPEDLMEDGALDGESESGDYLPEDNDQAEAEGGVMTEVDGELFETGAPDSPWTAGDVEQYVGTEPPIGESTHKVPLETDSQVMIHIIHVVLEEATSQHQSTNEPLRDTTYGLARKLMMVLDGSDGLVDTTVLLTSDELTALYRALTAGSTDYASRSGIPAMWGEFEQVRKDVNEVRQAAMNE